MRFLQAIYMTFLLALVDCLSGCVSTATLKEGKLVYEEKKPQEKAKKEFHQLVETVIPVTDDIELNADIFRPLKKSDPKTLVIMVPGSGNVSRKGEVFNDGINNYEAAIPMNYLWASALSEHGLFVLSYDKRTCVKSVNPQCLTNSQTDIETDGMVALARDLDKTFEFVQTKLTSKNDVRVVLMSTTQGAQTIAMSQSLGRAQGVVLLSPIVTDLESMWIKGLAHAATDASPNQKMRLMNQKESMISFFKSLKTGQFSESSIIRGASVKFWQSWIASTNQTLAALNKSGRSTLLLFSNSDSFSSNETIAEVKKCINKSKKIYIKSIQKTDRNFVTKERVSPEALSAVLSFIEGLPAES